MSGIQRLLGRRNYLLRRYLAHNDIHLNLRKQIHIHLYATVKFRLSFLNTTAKHIRHRHSGHANAIQGILQVIKLALLRHDRNLCQMRITRNRCSLRSHLHRYCIVHRNSFLRKLCRNCSRAASTEIVNAGSKRKVRISRRKSVLVNIQSFDLLHCRSPKSDRML